MEQVNPLVGVGLRKAKELPLHRLRRVLFEVDQDEEQFVFNRRQWTIAIGGIGPPNAVKPLHGLRLQRVLKAGRKVRNKLLELGLGQAGQSEELRLILGYSLVPEHRTSF